MRTLSLVLVISLVFVGFVGNVFADASSYTANASPTVVYVSTTNLREEIVFPQMTRNLIIKNYDSSDGFWVNFRGSDTDSITLSGKRHYIGPSGELTLNDFGTEGITIIYDMVIGSGEASPITVLSTY